METENNGAADVTENGEQVEFVGLPTYDVDGRYAYWRDSHVPILYDWIMSTKTMYQSTCIRWSGAPPTKLGQGSHVTREVVFTERTGSLGDPNTLEIAHVRVPVDKQTRAGHVAQRWSEDASRPLPLQDLRVVKRIFHPGEVNAIRAPRPNILITHTDAPEVFVWNTNLQPHRDDRSRPRASKPDAVLVGHTDNAEYAVETHTRGESSFLVASGGKDRRVLVWDVSGLTTSSQKGQVKENYHQEFIGHMDTVEDVTFSCQSDGASMASVGDDACLALWDRRKGNKPAAFCKGAHTDDINTVDWNPHDEHLLLTGSDDTCVRVWDRRRLQDAAGKATPTNEFGGHSDKLTRVQWHRFARTVFGSASNDEQLMIWDLSHANKGADNQIRSQVPAELMFCHVGHRGNVVDFQWSEDEGDPWLIASVSEDGEGSTLQIWRMLDLVYRPKDKITEEIRAVRNSSQIR